MLVSLIIFTGCISNDHNKDYNTKEKDRNSTKLFVTSSSLYPMLLSFKGYRNNIVGTTPWVKDNSNFNLIKSIVPKAKYMNMKAIDKSYKINVEEIEKLKPNIGLYYGNYQNDNLERIIPKVVNIDPGFKYKEDPVKEQIIWEKKISGVLGVKYRHIYKDEWKNTNDILTSKLPKKNSENIRGLFIWQNLKDIKVSGEHSYATTMMKMIGVDNVAKDLKVAGDSSRGISVSMEQIIKWNPDVIFLANGKLDDILGNSNKAKMWSKSINAIKNKKVYTTPIGTFNWGSVSSDTPLFPLWMLNKINSDLMTEKELRNETKRFYKNVYDFNLNNQWLDDIFKVRY